MDFSKINKNPKEFLKTCSEKELEQVLRKASESYYSSDVEILSDSAFDRLKDHLEEKYPKNKFISEIGAPILVESEKVKLPVHMGSMNKKKTEKEVETFIKSYPGEVVISDKLDGISFLLVIKNGKGQLLTRGDGTYGKDISNMIPNLNLPNYKNFKNMIIRGEMLITKDNFKKMGDIAANGRSYIAGLSNLKVIKGKKLDFMKYVDLVSYEIIEPKILPNKQFIELKKLGFKVVNNITKPNIEYEFLEKHLLNRKDESPYEIDGIIITQNKMNERNVDKNPKYSFAFKMDLDSAITKVIKVEWNPSKHGKLKPIVHIEKVELLGTVNSKATGNNADFIVKHKIGPGATIKLIKGGEIIPKIVEVIKPAKEGQMPDVEYKWNATHKEIVLDNFEDSNDVKLKKVITFFRTIGIEHIGPGIYGKMYENGYDTIKKICFIQKEELLTLPGIKSKSADNIYNNIHLIIDKPIKIELLVSGSCILGEGFGERVLNKITNKYPTIFTEELGLNSEKLNEIPSIQEKTSQKLLTKLDNVREFIKDNSYLKYIIKDKKKIKITKKIVRKFSGKNFVITGSRDKKIIEYVENQGGKFQNSVNKNTNVLICSDINSTSSKVKKAKELNIEIISIESFITNNNIS